MVVAEVSDSAWVSGWTSSRATAGCAWWDPDAARQAAIGEAIEHYCSSLVPNELPRTSHRNMTAAGERAVPGEAFSLYSAAQYAEPGFPFVPCTPDLRMHWAPGHSLHTDERVWVPASMVYTSFFYSQNPTRHEPLTHIPFNAGVASGPTWDHALTAALEEIIERDAVYLHWVSGAEFMEVSPPEWLRVLAKGPLGVLHTRFYYFPNAFGMPVVGALAEDIEAGIVVMGTACRPTPKDAALKSLAEAVQLLTVARALDNPDSALNRSPASSSTLKPWRQDRCYRPLYRKDWKDARDQLCHLQLYLDREMQDLLQERIGSPKAVSFTDLPTRPARESRVYLRSMAAARMESIAVDVTTTDIRAAGFHAVRVIVPGAYSNAPAAFPFLGGKRMNQAIRNAGKSGPCRLPLPYA